MTSPSSSLQDIHEAIQKHNPFNFRSIVKYQDIWNVEFTDVDFIHAHASNAILETLEQVQNTRDSERKVTSLVLTSEQGVGKTHLIRRIRRHLYYQDTAFVIYMSFALCSDINLIHYELRQAMTRSFSQSTKHSISQWQLLAVSIVVNAIKGEEFQPEFITLARDFDAKYRAFLKKGKNLVDSLLEKARGIFQHVDPDILRAVIWTLSDSYGEYAVKWLGGDELSSSKCEEMKLPNQGSGDLSKEPESFNIFLTVMGLLTKFKPVLICFDETEISQLSDRGFTAAQVLAFLVKKIFDSLYQSSIGYGVVMSSFMFPGVWKDQVSQLAGATDRMVSEGKEPIQLSQLDENSLVKLVKILLDKKFYTPHNLEPPSPLYPFEEAELREIGKKERPPIRYALRWCAENFKVKVPPIPPSERFQQGFEEKLQEDYSDAIEDNNILADALHYGFELLIGQMVSGESESGQTIESAKIDAVVDCEPKTKNSGYINFIIIGSEEAKPFKIGVAVLQQSNGNAFGAGLSRLVDYETFGLTRGCLVRSTERKIKKFWASYEQYEHFIQHQGGEHIELELEMIEPLLALKAMLDSHSIYDLTPEQIHEFARPIAIKSQLLLEIISDPSGTIDPSIIDDETLVKIVEGDIFPDNVLDDADESDLSILLNSDADSGIEEPDVADSVEEEEEETTQKPSSKKVDYRGKQIVSFAFLGKVYPVKSWRNVLVELCNILYAEHKKRKFVQCARKVIARKPYFSESPEGIIAPEFLPKVGLYLETNFSVTQTVVTAKLILSTFGYQDSDFSVHVVDRVSKKSDPQQ